MAHALHKSNNIGGIQWKRSNYSKHSTEKWRRCSKKFDSAEEDSEKRKIVFDIADNLAGHATIEERYFYPNVRERATEEDVKEAYDEHLEIKELILQGLNGTERPGFDGIVAALKGTVEHHVEEEENEFFPKVKKLIDEDALEAIGQAMETEFEEIMAEGAPRDNVRVESEKPAAI